MPEFLAWQNLIFYVPIAFGIVLVLAAALGFVEASAELDAEAAPDGESPLEDVDQDGLGTTLLSLLGVGRVPLSIVVMVAALVFGGAGVCVNLVLAPLLGASWLYAPLSVLAALAITLVATGACARGLARLIPAAESYAPAKLDLIGRVGTAALDVSPSFGIANVADAGGAQHVIRCRCSERAIAKGRELLVTDYDADRDVFNVILCPPEIRRFERSRKEDKV